jgi:outer membrane protein OmpA-like peptidoglycan-associated protein
MTWVVAIALTLASTATPPPRRHVVVTDTTCEILQPLAFARGSVELDVGSEATLAAIAKTLDANPSLRLVAVEADVSLADARELSARHSLAMRRAVAVRDRLIALGVAPARLLARAGTGRDPGIQFVVLARGDTP